MIDLEELRLAIRSMTRQQELYRVLKEELSARGYWRQLPRGNPREGFRKRLAKVNKL